MIDWTEVITAVIALIITAIIVPWINSKTKNEQLKKVFTEVGDAVATSADYVAKIFVDDIKAGGKLTDEDKFKAIMKAVDVAKNNISSDSIKYIEKSGVDLGMYLESKIEAYLKNK